VQWCSSRSIVSRLVLTCSAVKDFAVISWPWCCMRYSRYSGRRCLFVVRRASHSSHGCSVLAVRIHVVRPRRHMHAFLNNARPPSTSAGACRLLSRRRLRGGEPPRRMKPDASPSVHEDVYNCLRENEKRARSRDYLVTVLLARHAYLQGRWMPTVRVPRPRMSRAI